MRARTLSRLSASSPEGGRFFNEASSQSDTSGGNATPECWSSHFAHPNLHQPFPKAALASSRKRLDSSGVERFELICCNT